MNITKYLCKKFDKGCVATEYIVKAITSPSIIVGILYLIIVILIFFIIGATFNTILHNESLDIIRNILIGFIIVTVIFVICNILDKLYISISHVIIEKYLLK